MNRKIVGLCGLPGSGKSFLCESLGCEETYTEVCNSAVMKFSDVIDYILHCVGYLASREEVKNVFDSVFGVSITDMIGMKFNIVENSRCGDEFSELTFADPVKKIVCAVFDFPYSLVRTNSPDRETTKTTREFSGMTCREAMQFIGTEVFRNRINRNIWVDVMRNRINAEPEKNVIISDVRFENEAKLVIEDLKGELLKIRNTEKPTEITNELKLRHVSMWGFLMFPDEWFQGEIFNDVENGDVVKKFYFIIFQKNII